MSEETIFLTALERHTPGERIAFVETTCAGDDELRPAQPRRPCQRTRVRAEARRLWRMVIDACPGDAETMPQGNWRSVLPIKGDE